MGKTSDGVTSSFNVFKGSTLRDDVRLHLEVTNITPTFGVSNVKRYDIILSFKRNQKNLERNPS